MCVVHVNILIKANESINENAMLPTPCLKQQLAATVSRASKPAAFAVLRPAGLAEALVVRLAALTLPLTTAAQAGSKVVDQSAREPWWPPVSSVRLRSIGLLGGLKNRDTFINTLAKANFSEAECKIRAIFGRLGKRYHAQQLQWYVGSTIGVFILGKSQFRVVIVYH